MSRRTSSRVPVVLFIGIGIAAIVGLGAGTAVAVVPGLLSPAGISPGEGVTNEAMPERKYEQNSSGQSFGSAAEARSPENEPDLILVVATNGTEGYVFKSDLDSVNGQTAAESFTAPADALKWQESQGRSDQTIPVYMNDGGTVVGTFLVLGTDNQERVAEESTR
jgi:hypothetical protein